MRGAEVVRLRLSKLFEADSKYGMTQKPWQEILYRHTRKAIRLALRPFLEKSLVKKSGKHGTKNVTTDTIQPEGGYLLSGVSGFAVLYTHRLN